MQTLRDQDARRAWIQVQSKVAQAQALEAPPSMGDVFRQGFMHASMFQLAVCAPDRRASTTSRTQLLVAQLEAKKAKAVSAA